MFFTAWWRQSRRRCGPRSRVALPAVVDIPVELLRAVRSQDDALDLYPLPDGRVWLLLKSDKLTRIHSGRQELTQARVESDQNEPLYAAHLMAQGFEQLGEYPWFLGMSAGFLLDQAQRKLYATEREIRERMQQLRHVSDGSAHKERARAVMRERVVLGARDDYAMAFRGRKSFSNVR